MLIDHTDAGDVPAGQPEHLYVVHDALGSVVGLTNDPAALDALDPNYPGAGGSGGGSGSGGSGGGTGGGSGGGTGGGAGGGAGIMPALVERYDYDPYGATYIAYRLPSTYDDASETRDPDLLTDPAAWQPCESSRFGNPFLWTAQRYDPGVRLYRFLFRTYSPTLGRWMQRDPLEYVDGVSLYQYTGSSPLILSDALGLHGVTAAGGGAAGGVVIARHLAVIGSIMALMRAAPDAETLERLLTEAQFAIRQLEELLATLTAASAVDLARLHAELMALFQAKQDALAAAGAKAIADRERQRAAKAAKEAHAKKQQARKASRRCREQEHRVGKSRSKADKHEKGRARRQRDQERSRGGSAGCDSSFPPPPFAAALRDMGARPPASHFGDVMRPRPRVTQQPGKEPVWSPGLSERDEDDCDESEEDEPALGATPS
ncbi:MAG: RHS repeat-associated core domain-containing protein [Phycisphaerales bacterium]|nr:RHS repeat-associated core domain-containing protein [Phycisphaerales bacterium]